MRYLPADCGTCGHPHNIDGCTGCRTGGTMCPGWTPTAADADRIDSREAAEQASLGDKAILDATTSESIIRTLQRTEADTYAYTLDKPRRYPLLLALGLGPETEDDVKAVRIISVDCLALPDETWDAGVGTDDAIAIVGRWLADQPEYPTVAWALAANGVIAVDPDQERAAAHILCATDIDGRIYSFTRQADTGTLRYSVSIADGWARLLRGELDLDDPATVTLLKADRLNPGHEFTTNLAAITRLELEELITANAAAFGAEKDENPAGG